MAIEAAKAARGGLCVTFNKELNKKRPLEEQRQPKDDFVSALIENYVRCGH